MRSAGWLAILWLGIVLPDVLTRPMYILLPRSYWFVTPLHTPAGIVLSCLAVSGLFAASQRNRVFVWLLCGSGLHLLLDLTQKHHYGGYALAFPVSWYRPGFGWIGADQTLWLLPLWLVLGGIVYVLRRRGSGRAPDVQGRGNGCDG
jgi:hypothetical protein